MMDLCLLFRQVVERIGKCNKALVENALLVATDEKIAKETDVARDDIREVRVIIWPQRIGFYFAW